MNNVQPVLQLQSVVKNYVNKQVIKKINLEIMSGNIVSLLGVNGSGKTTLIKMMLGLEQPTTGVIYLNGFPPTDSHARLNVGVVPQVVSFIEELTARETLEWISQHYPHSQSIDNLIIHFSLNEFIDRRTGILSEGQKRRLALALAFAGNPKVIFLDEPTVGLDLQARLNLWKFIQEYRTNDVTIILTTHYLEEAQRLSDRILILHEGEIIADGTVDTVCSVIGNTSRLEDSFIKLLQ